jgi:hypothetical protein
MFFTTNSFSVDGSCLTHGGGSLGGFVRIDRIAADVDFASATERGPRVSGIARAAFCGCFVLLAGHKRVVTRGAKREAL